MVESRCGLICSTLECKKEFNCGGCVNLENPFWGSCRVKICCEGKGQHHCGECIDFPCIQLKEFSFDLEHGDTGRRIEQCKKWMG
jgi:hypothetical protein